MATKKTTAARGDEEQERLDAAAQKVALLKKQVNDSAVKQGLTTADRPLVTTVAEHSALLGPPIPTGIVLLDWLLGGGLPAGCSSKWWGAEGGGKSTAGLFTARGLAQRQLYTLMLLAEENDLRYAMETARFDPSSPYFILHNVHGSGEHAFEAMKKFLLEGRIPMNLIKLVIMDSLAGFEPKDVLVKTEKDGAEASANIGRVAKMYAEFFRFMNSTKAIGNGHLMMISQARIDIGAYGSPEKSVGGKATDHQARLIFKVTKGEYLYSEGDKKKEQPRGHRVKLTITKDGYRHLLMGRKIEFDVIYGQGVDNVGSYFDMLKDSRGLLLPSSGWFESSPELLERIELPDAEREQYKRMRGQETVRKALRTPEFYRAAKSYMEMVMETQGVATFSGTDAEAEIVDGETTEDALAELPPVEG